MNERDIFMAAVQKEGLAERQAYVAEACQGNEALRQSVEALLAAHERAGGFLANPAVAAPATVDDPAVREGPGAIIGPYKLLEQIGEGGFGVVYMAEQQRPFRRKVALKVVKLGLDTRQVVARFEAERQALALMDHPNIARVFDGGETASGRPYFVMELVRGVPITDFCDANSLSVPQRQELFVSVCQAVQHAHQKGIIHRDLKPSNLLLTLHDGVPVVKIIDFGISKALGQQLTEKTLFTNHAQMVGTPIYMSPEQAEMSGLDIDTRSDIYSLGVLLYELITGTTPRDKERLRTAPYDEVRRIIREEEPAKPSTKIRTLGRAATTVSANRQSDPKRLREFCKGALDWIVMKALEKDRNRRYETASAFAADVQRYLNDEAVEACPPSAWYRLRKFARRNRAALGVAGLVLVCIVLVGGLSGWLMRDRAARQREVDSKTLEALEAAEPRFRDSQPGGPALLAASQRMEVALESEYLSPEIRRRADQFRRDARMLGELDEIRLRQTESKNGEMFDSAGAEKNYADAFSAYGIDVATLEPSQAAARVRASAVREVLLAGLDGWMLLTPAQNRAHAWLQAVADEADDSAWRQTFRKAALAGDTKQLKELAGQAEALAQPPSVLARLGSVLDAAGLAQEAAATLRQAQRRYPGDFWINYDLGHFLSFGPLPHHPDVALGYFRAAVAIRPQSAEARSILGLALLSTGETNEAIAALQQAIALAPRFATARINLGHALRNQGLDEAIAAYREAVRVAPGFHEGHLCLADALKDNGQRDEAITEYGETLRLQKEFDQSQAHRYRLPTQRADYDRHQKNFAQARGKLVSVLMDRAVASKESGQFAKAFADLFRVLELDPNFAQAWFERARCYHWLGQNDKALTDSNKAIELDPRFNAAWIARAYSYMALGHHEKALADCNKGIELDANFWWAWDVRGLTYNALHRYDEALADLNRAVDLAPENSWSRYGRGAFYNNLQRYSEAVADWSKAIELDPKNTIVLNRLAWLLATCPDSKFRDWNKAVMLAKKAVELAPAVGNYWKTLGAAHYRAGSWKEAVATLETSMKLRKGGASFDWFLLAMAHWQLGDKEQARKWHEKAIDWIEKNQKQLQQNKQRDEELHRFRAEADELLGIKKKR